jgi:2'-5' RNA ligase|tara:strand:- start:1892 stop:2473 length:582 start_codon:yes stop_codon:yes gene_type:complete
MVSFFMLKFNIMLHRIFLAINLPEKAKATLCNYQEKLPELPAKWTKQENLHVTLLFLGNTSEKELEELQKLVQQTAEEHKQFSLSFTKLAYGPTPKQPRMIWAIGKSSKELLLLQKDLMNALGYQKEHPLSLHITLARLKEWELRQMEPEELPLVQEELDLEIPVSAIDIMESKLKRGGAEYTIVKSMPLSLS